MPFSKFVEIGRVAVLGDGPDSGKIAAIVNVIDQNRVLLDGPTAGVVRQSYPIKKLHLTPLKVNFAFNASTKIVRKEMEAEKVCKLLIFPTLSDADNCVLQVQAAWESSTWAKRMAIKKLRNGLNDFDRFKLRKAKSARNKIVAKALNTKKKQLRKAGKI